MRTALATLIALSTLAAAPVRADPPVRVARVSAVGGQVSVRPAGGSDWTQVTLNYPVTSGDALWTDVNSRIELHIGSSAVRMGDMTALEVTAIGDHRVHLKFSEGMLSVRVREMDPDDVYEVETPRGLVTIERPGLYRFDSDSLGDNVVVTTRHGSAMVAADDGSRSVGVSEQLELSANGTVEEAVPVGSGDAFDAWVNDRDTHEDEAAPTRYVSHEMTGYEDLDAYGAWHTDATYGSVWVPRVAVGWAPYRYGHWVFVRPWGWTWVDDAPWGFAPFHYGRWAWVSGGWAWVPGAYVAHPVYAPALVGFVGGSYASVSVSFGNNVAWFPLAPGEPYVPAYRVSPTYVRNVNITNVHVTNINVTNVTYVNRRVPGAVTAVSHDVFTGARPVWRSAVPVAPRDVERVPVVAAAPIASPRPESFGIRDVHVARPPATAFSHSAIDRRPTTTAARPATTTVRPVRPDINVRATESTHRPTPDINVRAPESTHRPTPDINVRAPESTHRPTPDINVRAPESTHRPTPDINVRAPEVDRRPAQDSRMRTTPDVNRRPDVSERAAPDETRHPDVNIRSTPDVNRRQAEVQRPATPQSAPARERVEARPTRAQEQRDRPREEPKRESERRDSRVQPPRR